MGLLKKLLIIPPIIIGVVIFMYMKGQKTDPQIIEAVEVARHVRVIEVQKVAVKPKVHGFGSVTPAKEWVATAQVSGEIIKVTPRSKKGAIHKAGTVIVTISPVDFELAIGWIAILIFAALAITSNKVSRRYLKTRNTPINELDLQVTVPVNVRKPGTEFVR